MFFVQPDVDPSRGLVALPSELNPPPRNISCQSGRGGSRFITSGRGGVPLQPDEPLDGLDILTDLRLLPATASMEASSATAENSGLTEAQTWIVNAQGKVELIATQPSAFRCS